MNMSRWILANGENLQVVLFFSLLVVLAVAERLAPRRTDTHDRPLRWRVNFFLTLLNLAAMSVLPISLVGAALWAGTRGWGLLHHVHLPAAAVIVVTLLVRAFISFLTHYLNHVVPLFWRVHRVHHLDTELDVSSTVRFHPLEFPIALLSGVPIVLAFGPSAPALIFYELLDVAVTLWSHSNVRLPGRVDRLLRYVVVTPDLHRVHHSAWRPETNSNFGAVFPLWDVIFGTFKSTPRDGHERMRLGLDEVRGQDAHRPLWLLASVAHDDLNR